MIEREKLMVYKERAYCECGGEMKPTVLILTRFPPIYPHSCEKCGNKECYENIYPRVVYEDIDEEENITRIEVKIDEWDFDLNMMTKNVGNDLLIEMEEK